MGSIARVLMTADTVGGVWQYAVQLSKLVAEQDGVRVVLATMGPPPSPAQRDEASAVPGLTLRTSDFSLEWMPDAWRDVDRAGEWLLRLESEYAPDIVHLNGYCHADLPWQRPTLVVGHSCVCSWWDGVYGCAPPPEWGTYIERVRRGLQRASAVAAPSRAMASALTRFYGAAHVSVVPNCRTERLWGPAAVKDSVIFAAGRVWDPAKNLAMLDRVAGQLSWPVYIAGDAAGPGVPCDRQAHGHAYRLGRLSSHDVARWMGRSAIYALPARYEPFGLSVLEAALCNCALVLGDIPSLRENWSGVAQFVHPGRPDELRDVLTHLIEHPTERQALARAARARAQEFTPDRHRRAYLTLYQDTVNAHGRIADSARAH